MIEPTDEPAMADLHPTRERRDFLAAVDAGSVNWSMAGCLIWRNGGNGRLHRRAERLARTVMSAGWINETGDEKRPYTLTEAGRAVLAEGTS